MSNWSNDPKTIVKKLKKGKRFLLKALDSIPESGWNLKTYHDAKWSANDILLHIIGWDKLLLEQSREWLKGNNPVKAEIDDDAYNELFLKSDIKEKGLCIDEFIKCRNSTIAFLENLSESELEYGLANESFIDLDMMDHDLAHVKNLNMV